MKRFKANDLKTLKSRGYGIPTAFSKRGNPDTASQIGAWKASYKDNDSGEVKDMEQSLSHESLLAQCLQIGTSAQVRVSIEFFRRKTADYSRAISEKADIDCLTQCGFIEDDKEPIILLQDLGQTKVESNEEERVEITLEYEDIDLDNPWVPRTKFGQLGIKKS